MGACAWDGAYVLAAALDAQPPGSFAGLRAVELGAGMGLPGLVLARLGAAVWLTDKPAATVFGRWVGRGAAGGGAAGARLQCVGRRAHLLDRPAATVFAGAGAQGR